MSITAKGFAFSVDLAITAIIIFLMLFLAASSFGAQSNSVISGMKAFQLQKNAVFLADALVKNNAENSLVGAALFDGKIHRVKSNELDFGKLKEAAELTSDEFFVRGLSVKWRDGKRETIFSRSKAEGNCIALDRLALIGNKTALVELVVCEK